MRKEGGSMEGLVCLLAVFVLLSGWVMGCAEVSKGSALVDKANSLMESVSGTGESKARPQASSPAAASSSRTQNSRSTTTSKATDAVNVIIKNNASSDLDVELIDRYGGNFTATISGGMSQNQTLKAKSPVKVNGNTVHVVSAGDEGKVIVVAH